MISRKEFEDLSPYQRGYAVYMAGKREDQLNIPDETNPFKHGTYDYREWNEGNRMACNHDMEERWS